jgi:hypothetical protein
VNYKFRYHSIDDRLYTVLHRIVTQRNPEIPEIKMMENIFSLELLKKVKYKQIQRITDRIAKYEHGDSSVKPHIYPYSHSFIVPSVYQEILPVIESPSVCCMRKVNYDANHNSGKIYRHKAGRKNYNYMIDMLIKMID